MKESQIRNYLKANGFEKFIFQNSLTFYHRNGIYTYIDRSIKTFIVMKDIEDFSDMNSFNLADIRKILVDKEGLEITTFCPFLREYETRKIFSKNY